MTVRLRVTRDDKVREFAFDRATISVGQGPFNDVVFAQSSLARVHGELELREDGSLAFRARASSEPTSVFRDGECMQTSDGVEEQTLWVQPGDVIRMGEGPSIDMEIVHVERGPKVEWSHRGLPHEGHVDLSEADGRFFHRLVRDVSTRPGLEHFLRAAVLIASRASGRVPTCAELAIPLEVDPWRSDDHMLQAIAIDAGDGFDELGPDAVDGDYMRTRDPLPPFDAEVAEILPALQAVDRLLVVQARGPQVNILLPLELHGELGAVLDLGFEPREVDALADAIAEAAPLLQPLAQVSLGYDRQVRDCAGVVEENRYWRERERRHYLFKDLIAESDAVREVYDKLDDFVDLSQPVLILGEAGSGKALVARALHHLGHRNEAMFTSINCGNLSSDQLDFELFGSVANELSGDVEPRKGVFELAEGGTVFLEEVDQLSLMLQGKLLRMLREREVRRIGDAVGRPVDVRLIASTHRDLSALVSRGSFRRDLYMAINEHVLRLPPLRDRKADILPLARTFLRKFADRYDRPCRRIGQEVEDKLVEHHWNGNVRELQSVMEAAVLKCDGVEIGPDDLGL